MLKDLHLNTLQIRHKELRLIMVYEIINNHVAKGRRPNSSTSLPGLSGALISIALPIHRQVKTVHRKWLRQAIYHPKLPWHERSRPSSFNRNWQH